MAKSMISVEQAEALIAQQIKPTQMVNCFLENVAGEILRIDVCTERDEPPFDRVMMDGIAMHHSSVANGQRRYVVQAVQAAGEPPQKLKRDDACIEIMTGAVLPKGCDCVIPVEDIEMSDGRVELRDGVAPKAGQYIHRRGSDRACGARVLEAGTLLGAAEVAALAASGQASVSVAQRPRISVISTGDELVNPGTPIESYQVRRTNPYGVVAALRIAGFTDTHSAHVPDEPSVMRREIEAHLSQSEVVVLSGGVSMGKHDHVPAIMDSMGVTVHFHRVAERPGKPLWFGTGADGQLVFALPGNPVAVQVCLYRFVLPALERMLGRTSGLAEQVELAAAVEFAPRLTWFLPVRLQASTQGTMLAQPNPPKTSGDVMSLAGTDGFVELAAEQMRFPAGYVVPLFRWRPRA
jgi:molybdopterin molybdotransferase